MIHLLFSLKKEIREETGEEERKRRSLHTEPRETAPSEVNRGSIVLRGLTGSCRSGDRATEKTRGLQGDAITVGGREAAEKEKTSGRIESNWTSLARAGVFAGSSSKGICSVYVSVAFGDPTRGEGNKEKKRVVV